MSMVINRYRCAQCGAQWAREPIGKNGERRCPSCGSFIIWDFEVMYDEFLSRVRKVKEAFDSGDVVVLQTRLWEADDALNRLWRFSGGE